MHIVDQLDLLVSDKWQCVWNVILFAPGDFYDLSNSTCVHDPWPTAGYFVCHNCQNIDGVQVSIPDVLE